MEIAILMILIAALLLFFLWAAYRLAIRGRTGQTGLQELRRWSYAHRGLHSEGVPENSMAAFKAAKEGGYGVELDVHLLADGNLAVVHDSLLKRVTGLPGTIEELTTEQLQSCRLCGTEETIPEFSQVLKLFNGDAPLIVELKATNGNHAALSRAVCDMLAAYSGPYCLESFDPRCILWLKKNRPNLIRGQLVEDYVGRKFPKAPLILRWLMRENMSNFLTKPDFIAYRFEDRGCTRSNVLCSKRMARVSWTLTSQEDYDTAVKEGWIPIFEGFTPDPDALK